ncbi:MAG: ATP-binding cassette domain-containing protein, partial [bacterium]
MLKVNINKLISNFNIDFNVEIESAFTALFGPSGAGKTTTLNLIVGLMEPTRGEIILHDRILFSKEKKINIAPQNRHIGYIFQESRLFPHLTVKKNLEFGLHKIHENSRKFNFDEIVQVTGVGPLLNRVPEDLSGGEKQRVALARALLASPDYLLMDEPLAALDLPARLSFLKFLKKIHKQFDLPILYVSHDLSNVLNFADQV